MALRRHVLEPFCYPLYIGVGWEDLEPFRRALQCSDEWTAVTAGKADASTHRQDATIPMRLGIYLNEGTLAMDWDRHVIKWLPGVIAHEALHAWDYITDAIGESAKTDEIASYMVQHITNLVWNDVLRRKRSA